MHLRGACSGMLLELSIPVYRGALPSQTTESWHTHVESTANRVDEGTQLDSALRYWSNLNVREQLQCTNLCTLKIRTGYVIQSLVRP
jgi:hypothetical protein